MLLKRSIKVAVYPIPATVGWPPRSLSGQTIRGRANHLSKQRLPGHLVPSRIQAKRDGTNSCHFWNPRDRRCHKAAVLPTPLLSSPKSLQSVKVGILRAGLYRRTITEFPCSPCQSLSPPAPGNHGLQADSRQPVEYPLLSPIRWPVCQRWHSVKNQTPRWKIFIFGAP